MVCSVGLRVADRILFSRCKEGNGKQEKSLGSIPRVRNYALQTTLVGARGGEVPSLSITSAPILAGDAMLGTDIRRCLVCGCLQPGDVIRGRKPHRKT